MLLQGKEIGTGKKCYIVAEIGSNWQFLKDCLESIELAQQVGADAVKFQLFTPRDLYGIATPEHSSKLRCLQVAWLPELKAKADSCGIDFMCSAFSPHLIDLVNPFVDTHKVASAEMTHVRMLEKLNYIKKPVFLSTGGHSTEEIQCALDLLPNCKVVILYCVSSYPAREIQLGNIEHLKKSFPGYEVGYSDHSVDVLNIPYMASKLGCVVEKHVNFVGADGPDAPHSISYKHFKAMVQEIRGGTLTCGVVQEEQEMIWKHSRRLVALRPINIGETLLENTNYGIFRGTYSSLGCTSPFLIKNVEGTKAHKFYSIGDYILLP